VRVLVTGEADEEITRVALDLFHLIRPIKLVIETGGKTAELYARFWADDNDVPVETIREKTKATTAIEAFKLKPTCVLAFPWPELSIVDRAKRTSVQVCRAEIKDRVPQQSKQDLHEVGADLRDGEPGCDAAGAGFPVGALGVIDQEFAAQD
jgi:hypothetical protein